VKPSELLGP